MIFFYFQTAVDDIIDGARRLSEQNEHLFAARLLENLQTSDNLSVETVKRVVEEIQTHRPDPFENIDSSYLHTKYYEKSLQFIKPQDILLGERAVRKQSGKKCFVVAKTDYAYYIPIIENIKNWLSNERIQHMVLSPPECMHGDEGFLVDFCCGDILRQHDVLMNGNTLPLILYYDEIDVCNPIGTRASVHKLGMFYFTFGNIDLKFRSRLSAIRLVAITSSKNINRYGIDKILEPFLEDMMKLSEGISFSTDAGNVVIRGALLAVVADTPASHQLGGFKEGVGGAYSKCRQCECSEDNMQVHFIDNNFIERNSESHINYCEEIENAATSYMKNHLKTTYGINRRSILMEFPGFDVTKMLPQDIMHVMLEGVVQHEIKQVLQHLVEKGELDLDKFNKKLTQFQLSYFDRKDKPCEIQPTVLFSDDSRLKQTASQMMVFLKILPFVLLGLVSSENEHFRFIIQLLNIYHILVSPVISLGALSILKDWINDHLKKFKELFPNLTILPKQHYLIHFPKTIKRFGPPIRYSCMRFEAKHKYFKRLAVKQNFLNLSKTLATRYQKEECISQVGDDPYHHPLFSSELSVGPPKALSHIDIFHLKRQISLFCGQDASNSFISAYSSNHVTVCGTKYLINQCYLLVGFNFSMPQFGLLKKIYIVNSTDIMFETEMLDTVKFDKDLQAYQVEQPCIAQGFEFCRQSDLIDYTCYGLVYMNETAYIPIEYDLFDLIDMNEMGMTIQ